MKRGRFALLFSLIMIMSSFLVFGCVDEDADGYGLDGAADCAHPGNDCNDNNPSIHPDATEIINGIDDNCNGLIDDGVVLACTDSDLDGYNSSSAHPIFCPTGTCCSAPEDIDCDDSSYLINPGLEEICGDGKDNDCDAATSDTCPEGEDLPSHPSSITGCSMVDAYWADCDGAPITTAAEGDSVFLVVATDRCSEDSLVDYIIKETDTGTEIGTVTEEYFGNIEANVNAWAAKWITGWLSTSQPNPEYIFTGKVMTPDEGNFEIASDALTVTQCPAGNPDCGMECNLETASGFVSIGGRSARQGIETGPGQVCAPLWDCTNAVWSECDTATGQQTRDVNLCVYTGRGDMLCEEESKTGVQAEKICTSSQLQQTPTDYTARSTGRRTIPESECGDGACDADEDSDTCPDDCMPPEEESSSWWLWPLIILLLIGLIIGAFLYYRKINAKPAAGLGKSPFDSEKDMGAVTGYIKASRSKNVPDAQIKGLLKKSGWSDAQVAYAFKSLDKPAAKPADNKAAAAKPADTKAAKPAEIKK